MDFYHTHISERSIELAVETLRSTFISEGILVKQFEDELARRLGVVNPIAVNSGTSALHLALDVAGIGLGDEVILPAQTFVATGLVVLMQRAVPVFADIDPSTGNIDPAAIRKAITPRTKAIIPVHWAGYPCDMDEINVLASEHGLAVIEDAAHALGAQYHGRPIGSISRFTCFSFQAIKHLTTGDGGAICCLDARDNTLSRQRRWFGIDRDQDKAGPLGERLYSLDHVGYKYHMNDLAAAVGLGNLTDFLDRLERRRQIAKTYRKELCSVPGVTLLKQSPDRESACWLFTLKTERRVDVIRKLAAAGIPSSVVHQRVDHHPALGGLRTDLPGQDEFDARQLSIPLHEGLTERDLVAVINAICSGW